MFLNNKKLLQNNDNDNDNDNNKLIRKMKTLVEYHDE